MNKSIGIPAATRAPSWDQSSTEAVIGTMGIPVLWNYLFSAVLVIEETKQGERKKTINTATSAVFFVNAVFFTAHVIYDQWKGKKNSKAIAR